MKTFKNMALAILGVVAVVGIFSVPAVDSANWFSVLLATKAAGAGAVWGISRLRPEWFRACEDKG